ncbi:MAG: response regulator transcription factor [Acidobacteriaceae bacterium]|nr:response regulator transcription factor [Acidobacteriaceae bacterium]
MSNETNSPLILLVEDEEHLAQGLVFNLEAEGYHVHHEADGRAALQWLLSKEETPAAVLLDVMLPGLDGFAILRALREAGMYTPVLMLTARGRTEDIVEGFAAGADDYLAKPFDLNILFARLAGLLRRMHWQQGKTVDAPPPTEEPATRVEIAGRVVDLEALEIHHDDQVIRMTLMEAELLRYLLEHPGKVIARKEILENVWHVHEDTDTRAMDNFIVRLRRHLEPDPTSPRHLLTVRGVGYRFMPNPEA